MKKTLVIGIGNAGRADDGLGWAFVDKLVDDDRFDVVHRYQLQVEDAELIASYDNVWFIDASHIDYDGGFKCETLKPEGQFTYTTHELHPGAVVYLCYDLYKRFPNSRLMGISGEDWDLGHTMSATCLERLERAFAYFQQNWSYKPEMVATQ